MIRPASLSFFRWWLTVGCDTPTFWMSQTEASPLWWAATREKSRRRTGSASALNMPAMRSASVAESSAAPSGGHGNSTVVSPMSSVGIVMGVILACACDLCHRSGHNVTSPISTVACPTGAFPSLSYPHPLTGGKAGIPGGAACLALARRPGTPCRDGSAGPAGRRGPTDRAERERLHPVSLGSLRPSLSACLPAREALGAITAVAESVLRELPGRGNGYREPAPPR